MGFTGDESFLCALSMPVSIGLFSALSIAHFTCDGDLANSCSKELII